MSIGGYRRGAGRPKGIKEAKPRRKKGWRTAPAPKEPTEQEKVEKMLGYAEMAKKKTLSEYLNRIGQGGTLTLAEKRHMEKLGAEIKATAPKPTMESLDLEAEEYLRQVWNDPNMEPSLRIRAAEVVLKGDGEKKGKKDEKADRAVKAGKGRFAASAPPLKLVSK